MRLFGRELTVRDIPLIGKWAGFTSVGQNYNDGWWGVIKESFGGAWQNNITLEGPKQLTTNSAVFACLSMIPADIAKLPPMLLSDDNEDEITQEIRSGSPWNPVLRKPNHYQNRIQFLAYWISCKLLNGNAYILKGRDSRGVVNALYPLDPNRVTVLISDEGSVWYQLGRDDLSGVPMEMNGAVFPASEIIHDRMNCFFHPLVGIGALYAAAYAATVGNKISANSAQFFANMSRPSGILTAPGAISNSTASRLKEYWETNFGGTKIGKVAVMGDGLDYKTLAIPADQAQLVEQMKWTIEDIARCFHMPLWKIGGPMPDGATTEQLNQLYYDQCLNPLIEDVELCLTDGLSLPGYLKVELNIKKLLRMDQAAQSKILTENIKGALMKPNEARAELNLPPVKGGDEVYLQQQNFSLAALAKRDAKEDPFAKSGGATPSTNGAGPEDDLGDESLDDAKEFLAHILKGLECQTP